ncbi:MAG: HD domain-containing protein [Rhodospirillales bacterium]|nr:HD domain-containing protein [Rhodospirillales bacterium]
MSQLTPVLVVTSDAKLGIELKSMLEDRYILVIESDASKVIDQISTLRPLAIIIDDDLKPRGGLKFLSKLREGATAKSIPTLLLIARHQENIVRKTDYLGELNYIIKPFKRDQLRGEVSGLVNKGVEKSWDTLPPVQRSVLNETVSIFRDSFRSIQNGQPIPVVEIEKSCQPLVQAVTDNQVTGLLDAVQNHDDYTYVHSLRVAIYLALFGHSIGIKGKDLLTLSSGGLMHDLGKCRIPHDILNKPGRLSESEFDVMKTHVHHTGEIFDSTGGIGIGVQTIALQHHEKIDGSGYPKGISGVKLDELSRMATIVDIYSALTDRRVYKPAMEPVKAIGILESIPGEVDQKLLGKMKDYLLQASGLPEL